MDILPATRLRPAIGRCGEAVGKFSTAAITRPSSPEGTEGIEGISNSSSSAICRRRFSSGDDAVLSLLKRLTGEVDAVNGSEGTKFCDAEGLMVRAVSTVILL